MTQTASPHSNLINIAADLPQAWSSSILANVGNANFKVLRMDEREYADESHPYVEVLLVLDGQLNLLIDQQLIVVQSGESYTIPAHTPHAVTQGSFGTLVILDVNN
ncbi:MAG: cupin domain-containing protein [Formosimonas sp.]|jgi:quercetin dioxygenase-like cupin family protein